MTQARFRIMRMNRHLELAREHLVKVQTAWVHPVDWTDLAMFGFFSLENAVVAAAEHLGLPWQPTHPNKVQVAVTLHESHGLPDIMDLLQTLGAARLSVAYGDVPMPDNLDPEDVAHRVESYFSQVERLTGGKA